MEELGEKRHKIYRKETGKSRYKFYIINNQINETLLKGRKWQQNLKNYPTIGYLQETYVNSKIQIGRK